MWLTTVSTVLLEAEPGFTIQGSLIYWLNQQLGSQGEAITVLLFVLGVAACAITAYLIGSISPVIIYTKKKYNEDIRLLGTKSADPFNLYMVYGLKDAVLSMLLDAADALLSCGIGFAIMGQEGVAIATFFCVFGHMFPIFHKMKGGKGIVALIFGSLWMSPITFLILVPLFLLVLLASRFYTLASVMYAFLLPLILRAFHNSEYYADWYMYMTILAIVFVVITQREGLSKLLHGQEKRFDIGKKHIPLKKQEEMAAAKEQETKSRKDPRRP